MWSIIANNYTNVHSLQLTATLKLPPTWQLKLSEGQLEQELKQEYVLEQSTFPSQVGILGDSLNKLIS